MKFDILDSMIAIAIILFILSMIVEKITQLIRNYSPFNKSTFWKNIKRRQTGKNASFDKIIEREVISLSFMLGSLIALAFRVDLFMMIASGDPRTVLFWNPDISYTDLQKALFVISIPLTGLFLSFGSKFFHDPSPRFVAHEPGFGPIPRFVRTRTGAVENFSLMISIPWQCLQHFRHDVLEDFAKATL
ncbi:MAG: hypothetical protein ABIN36_11695 [Ferruginibacter sp.]